MKLLNRVERRHPETRQRGRAVFSARVGVRDPAFEATKTQGPSGLLAQWIKLVLAYGPQDDVVFEIHVSCRWYTFPAGGIR